MIDWLEDYEEKMSGRDDYRNGQWSVLQLITLL